MTTEPLETKEPTFLKHFWNSPETFLAAPCGPHDALTAGAFKCLFTTDKHVNVVSAALQQCDVFKPVTVF